MRLTIALLVASLSTAPAAFAANDDQYCHEFRLHASDDPLKNGADLLDLVAHIKDASSTRPYVIHLEAGIYSVKAPVILLPYISMKGAGMTSTILQAASSSMFQVLFFQDQTSSTYVQALSNESLSDMTIIGNQPLSVTVNGFFEMHNVQLIPTSTGDSCIDLITVGSHFFVTNSLLGSLELDSPTLQFTTASPVSSIIGSEVDLDDEASSVFTLACLADYNSSGQAVPTACH